MVAPTDANSQPVPTRPSKLPDASISMVASSEGRLAITPELVVGPASNRLRSHALNQVGSEVAYARVSMFQPSRRSRRRNCKEPRRLRWGSICTPALVRSVPSSYCSCNAKSVDSVRASRVMPGPRPSANRVSISPVPRSSGRFQSTLDTTLPERFWTPKPRSGCRSKRPEALNGTPTSLPPTRSRALSVENRN